jgi:hypothetical protein
MLRFHVDGDSYSGEFLGNDALLWLEYPTVSQGRQWQYVYHVPFLFTYKNVACSKPRIRNDCSDT